MDKQEHGTISFKLANLAEHGSLLLKVAEVVDGLLTNKESRSIFEQYRSEYHKKWAEYYQKADKTREKKIAKRKVSQQKKVRTGPKLQLTPDDGEPRTEKKQLEKYYLLLIIIHDWRLPHCALDKDTSQHSLSKQKRDIIELNLYDDRYWDTDRNLNIRIPDAGPQTIRTALWRVETDLKNRGLLSREPTEWPEEKTGPVRESQSGKPAETKKSPTLTEDQTKTLNYLKEEFPTIRYQREIAAIFTQKRERKTVKTILDDMMEKRLVSRPENKQKGYVITPFGREYYEEHYA